MGLRERGEIQALIKLAAEQRRRLKQLQASLDDLYRRIGRVQRHQAGGEADLRSGKATKPSRKK